MKAGDLVSDDLIMGIMEERLKEDDCQAGYLLDGFPRTIPQAEALKVLLDKMGEKLDCAVEIDVPREVILDRLTTRRTCESCGEIYNVKSNPTKVEGVCDKCGGPVTQRDDETEEAISNRLNVYNEQTAPLVGFYKNEGMLLSVEATSSDAVIEAIKGQLGK
jgi:adenylate kinase